MRRGAERQRDRDRGEGEGGKDREGASVGWQEGRVLCDSAADSGRRGGTPFKSQVQAGGSRLTHAQAAEGTRPQSGTTNSQPASRTCCLASPLPHTHMHTQGSPAVGTQLAPRATAVPVQHCCGTNLRDCGTDRGRAALRQLIRSE
jgi:hypothetical protein